MRIELKHNSVDVVVTKLGFRCAWISALACIALLLIGGLKVFLTIGAAVIFLTAPVYAFEHRPLRSTTHHRKHPKVAAA